MSPQVWSHYEETPVEEVVPVLEEKERTANYKPVFVTEITDDLHFYVQDVETGTGATWAPPAPRGAPQMALDGMRVCNTQICVSRVMWGHLSTPQDHF